MQTLFLQCDHALGMSLLCNRQVPQPENVHVFFITYINYGIYIVACQAHPALVKQVSYWPVFY